MAQETVDVEMAYADGELIVREGEIGSDMFIIKKGGAQVSKMINGQDVTLTNLERGDFFGEMAVLESSPRSATVRAIGATKVLVLGRGDLLLRIGRDPTFAFEMLQQMSHRVRVITDRLSSLQEASHIVPKKIQAILPLSRLGSPMTDGE